MVKWWHRSWRLQKEWLRFELYRAEDYNKVVCDVAVHTICVALDAPVSRSCKTYPVTQPKQNNWTGEASLRPGKCEKLKPTKTRVTIWPVHVAAKRISMRLAGLFQGVEPNWSENLEMLDHLRMDIKGGGHKSTELFLFLERLHIMMKRLDVMQIRE